MKADNGDFHVTIGSHDGLKVRELVGLFMLMSYQKDLTKKTLVYLEMMVYLYSKIIITTRMIKQEK